MRSPWFVTLALPLALVSGLQPIQHHHRNTHTGRVYAETIPILLSSKPKVNRRKFELFPLVYRGAAAALVAKCPLVYPPSALTLIQLSTAAIIIVDFEPTGNTQLKEALDARTATRRHNSVVAGNLDAALKWRRLVQLKELFEFAGVALLLSAKNRVAPVGAGVMLIGHALFWKLGAGAARVTAEGVASPFPPKLSATILKADLVLAGAAVGAGLLPIGGWPRAVCAAVYATGIAGVVGEKLAGRMKRKKALADAYGSASNGEEDNDAPPPPSASKVSSAPAARDLSEPLAPPPPPTSPPTSPLPPTPPAPPSNWQDAAKAAQLQRMLNTKSIDGVRGRVNAQAAPLQTEPELASTPAAKQDLNGLESKSVAAAQAARLAIAEADARTAAEAVEAAVEAAKVAAARAEQLSKAETDAAEVASFEASKVAQLAKEEPINANAVAQAALKAEQSVKEEEPLVKAETEKKAAEAGLAEEILTVVLEETGDATSTAGGARSEEGALSGASGATSPAGGFEDWALETRVDMGFNDDPQVPEEQKTGTLDNIKNTAKAGIVAFTITAGASWLISLYQGAEQGPQL